MTGIVSPYVERKASVDMNALRAKIVRREEAASFTTAAASPISILAVAIMQWNGAPGILWLIPVAIIASFIASIMGINVRALMLKKAAAREAINVPWQLHDNLQMLHSSILNIREDKRNNFRQLWDSAVQQCQAVESPTAEETKIINAFLLECSTAVKASKQAEEELIAVLSKADPSDPQVAELKQAFSLNMTSTEALEEVRTNLQAIREATKEFEAKAS